MTISAPAQTRRTQRLDSLPFTREHRKVLAGSGIGWALDAMDVGLISFVLAQLAIQWNATSLQLSLIASSGFVGMAIGAALGGLLADRLGRRYVFATTLLVYGVATGASALASTVAVLIALRFVVGLGLGAELPVASTLVSEFSPPRIRGRIIVILESFWAFGWIAAAVIGYVVIPQSADGWRWALLIGAVPALYAVVVRFTMPESVRFLESRGRTSEAEATVRRFELSAGRGHNAEPIADEIAESDSSVPAKTRIIELFSTQYRARTTALWLVWLCVNFSYYGAFIWLPTILVASGFSLVRSFEYTLIITVAQLPGYACSAWLIEKWGRRRTLAVFLVGSACSAVFFGLASNATGLIIAGMFLSFFNLGAWGALYAVTPELYPTRMRATGAGWAASVGRIAAILAPLAVPLLRDLGGIMLLFVVFAAFFVIAALSSLWLPEHRGRALET